MDIKCFLIEPNGLEYRSLRRYAADFERTCPVHGFHNAEIPLPDGKSGETPSVDSFDKKEFPIKCDCGYEFSEKDNYQVFSENQYICSDKPGELFNIRKAPIGAMWRAIWYEDYPGWCGTDGQAYIVETPGGPWHIDGQASNCTRPNDQTHKCWCRHGEAPNFTVDKNGNTCAAGAGSILIGNYHGFLRNGHLTDC